MQLKLKIRAVRLNTVLGSKDKRFKHDIYHRDTSKFHEDSIAPSNRMSTYCGLLDY